MRVELVVVRLLLLLTDHIARPRCHLMVGRRLVNGLRVLGGLGLVTRRRCLVFGQRSAVELLVEVTHTVG